MAEILARAGTNPITDVNTVAVEGIAITALSSGNGTWQYSLNGGSSWTSVGTVSNTSALLLRETDRLRFLPDAKNGTTASITFRAWDQATGSVGTKVSTAANGGTTAFSTATESASILVTSVNDAPVLNTSLSPALVGINEDAPAPMGAVGTLVSTLVGFASGTNQANIISDVDTGALFGIAITATNTTNGTWFYSTDGGANWQAVGTVSTNSARLLAADANTRLYFQPNRDFNGTITDAITLRAWDQSSGANGELADTSVSGGSTAFSAATDQGTIKIASLNDAPVLDVTKTPGAGCSRRRCRSAFRQCRHSGVEPRGLCLNRRSNAQCDGRRYQRLTRNCHYGRRYDSRYVVLLDRWRRQLECTGDGLRCVRTTTGR